MPIRRELVIGKTIFFNYSIKFELGGLTTEQVTIELPTGTDVNVLAHLGNCNSLEVQRISVGNELMIVEAEYLFYLSPNVDYTKYINDKDLLHRIDAALNGGLTDGE